MFPRPQDLLLAERVKLYDNVAQINDCQGRLLAELQIYPSPKLNWEFEMLGEVQCSFPAINFNNISEYTAQINGYMFILEQVYQTGDFSGLGPLRAARGIAGRAVYGSINSSAHKFIFCLSNARFQHTNNLQSKLFKTVNEQRTGREVQQAEEGRFIDLEIDDVWNIRLEIKQNALSWLDLRSQNIGTLITTLGELYQPAYKATQPETLAHLRSITFTEGLKRLDELGRLLSYLNGGFTAALYVEGQQYTGGETVVETVSVVAQIRQSTSLDRLGQSWNAHDSDLKAYVGCLPAFERMMQNQFWQDAFDFFLIKYFQAIQNFSWQIAASEIGSVLERLSYTILVEEEFDATRRANIELLFEVGKRSQAKKHWNLGKKTGQEDLTLTGKCLALLLERIGLTRQRGHSDVDDVQLFLDVRNDSVHPRVSSIALEDRLASIKKAIQWADEVMLWRLGYSGRYLSRSQHLQLSIPPRYDLSNRSPNW